MGPVNILNSAEPPAPGWRRLAVQLDKSFHQHARYLGSVVTLPGESMRKKKSTGFLTEHQHIHLAGLSLLFIILADLRNK